MNYGHTLRFGLHLTSDADCGPGPFELAFRAGPSAAASGTADSVAALGEAIAVVRELWNVPDRGLGRFAGRFYRLAGAEKAAPAHDVPISVDGQDQDLLRLVGLVGLRADEWSTGCAAATLTQGNRAVDEAARGAGRDPREIRRRVTIRGGFGKRTGRFTGTAADWVNDLLPLVVEHGVGTIVLDTEHRDVAAGFGSEVAPALRAAVDAVLPRGWSGARVRRSAVRARLEPLAAISAMYAQDIVVTFYAAVMDNARVMGCADEVVDRAWAWLLSPFLDGLYISFDSSLRPERIAAAWHPRTLSRLRELKSVYDPEGVFGDNFALTPAANHPGGSTP
ncbi:hypothetical protein [Streptomyces tendae]